MAISTPWAILLCKFKNISDEPQPKSFFQQLFCAQGLGMGGLVDYWQEISYGTLDLTGSQVFGWFQLDHTFAEDKQLDRYNRIMRGILSTKGAVDFPQFYGIVVILNAPNIDMGSVGRMDLDLGSGGKKTYGLVVLDATPTVWSTSAAAHETGHGYGLNHSWGAMPADVEYGDAWDIMSYGGCYYFQGANFGNSGPGLIAPYLIQMDWIEDWRVEDLDVDAGSSVYLEALGHPEGVGSLAARLDLVDDSGDSLSYVIEYRHPDRWDFGIGPGIVLVHEVRANGLSYLKSALKQGEQYVSTEYGFIVEVQSIDSVNARAYVSAGRLAHIWLDGDVTTTSTQQIGSGTIHFPGFMSCPAGDYEYTEQHQVQTANYVTKSYLFDQKTVQYDWFLESTLLSPTADNVALLVNSSFPLPLESGGSSSIREVIVTYSIQGASIYLQTRPEDGNYSLTLRVHAHDAGGRSDWAIAALDFEGDVVVFEQDYYLKVLKCIQKIKWGATKHKTKPKGIARGGDPGPYKDIKRKIAKKVHDGLRAQPHQSEKIYQLFGHISEVRRGHGLRKTKKKKKGPSA